MRLGSKDIAEIGFWCFFVLIEGLGGSFGGDAIGERVGSFFDGIGVFDSHALALKLI